MDSLLEIYAKTQKFLDKKPIEEVYFTQLLENLRPEFLLIEQKMKKSLQEYNKITELSNPVLENKLEQGREQFEKIE